MITIGFVVLDGVVDFEEELNGLVDSKGVLDGEQALGFVGERVGKLCN